MNRKLLSFISRKRISTTSTGNQNNRPKISQVFFNKDVQNLLKDITRFDKEKIFARKPVDRLKSPKMMFMSDKQLEVAYQQAYDRAKPLFQMPPVLEPDLTEPEILSKDEEIVGYTKHRIMFVDISPGYSNRTRLMSVRELDGTLRYPSHEERSRLNHIFYPAEDKSIDRPQMFEEGHMSRLLDQCEYIYILDRACLQFEPDEPDYVDITSQVYLHIDDRKHYDKLRSTRHFGPMSLYLAYNDRANNLIVDMITRGFKEDAIKLVKIYNICHDITQDDQDPESILAHYIEQHSLSNLL